MPSAPARLEWHITDAGQLASVIAYLKQAKPPFRVTIQPGEERRRSRQSRFVYEAYARIAEALGDHTPSEVRAITKLCVGVPILRAEDEAFREKYDAKVRPFPYEQKLEFMLEPWDFPVTRLMSVRQMSDYIRQMLQFWDERGAPGLMLSEFE